MNMRCPLCGSENYAVIYDCLQQSSENVVKCTQCFHVYTHSANNNQENLYNDKVYKVVENRGSFFNRILTWEYKKVIKRINSYKPLKGRLLDFGSGKGLFGSLANKSGWKAKCVETSRERAEYAKINYGLDVNTDNYIGGKIFASEFDVLTLFHVLEHLPYPLTLLNELTKNNLKENALIVIEVPNFKSLQSRIAGKRWLHLDIPRHLNHFVPLKLEELGQQLNFTTLKTTFFSFHLGVLGMTDSLLKLFHYRGNIIYELKNKKNFSLIFCILLLLPFSLLFEYLATAFGQGGIIRKYFIRNPNESRV